MQRNVILIRIIESLTGSNGELRRAAQQVSHNVDTELTGKYTFTTGFSGCVGTVVFKCSGGGVQVR